MKLAIYHCGFCPFVGTSRGQIGAHVRGHSEGDKQGRSPHLDEFEDVSDRLDDEILRERGCA